jgi:hypothetical protein
MRQFLAARCNERDWNGVEITNQQFQRKIDQEAIVRDDRGEILGVLLKGRIPPELLGRLTKELRTTKVESRNRGAGSGFDMKTINADGTKTKTHQTNPVGSGLAGYFDRTPRTPYARECNFSRDYPGCWEALKELAIVVSECFREIAPKRWEKQQFAYDWVNCAWRIPETVFTTITVNDNFTIRGHKDAGDLVEGLGALAYIYDGRLKGGYVVMPNYDIAFQPGHGDILLMNVHEYHGVTQFLSLKEGGHRYSLVFYLREKLICCGDPAHEEANAKNAVMINRLYSEAELGRLQEFRSVLSQKFGEFPYG